MNNSTLYLKYRPTQLADLVGQDLLVKTLGKSSERNIFSHAYTFAGNKGCGKTTTARILANLLNCESPKNGSVCGKCHACLTIPFGRSTDVVELDGAKDGTVEKIQELIESTTWNPVELNKKVYIIDEAHQLTSRAISALLKIVEEPPEYVVFIFCTTEINKIPDTILSRTQNFKFNKISNQNIASFLKKIAEKEKILINDDALLSLANISSGSMRDAIGHLEQISIVADGKEIGNKHVEKYYGISGKESIYKIVKSIINMEIDHLVEYVNELVVASVSVEDIAREISEVFRNIMIFKAQGCKIKLLNLPEGEMKHISEFSERLKLSQLDKMANAFSSIRKELTYSINERWVLESTLIRCAAVLNKQ